MDQNKVKELMEKEEFLLKILKLEKPEDFQAAFKAEGADISLDEAKAIATLIAAQVSGRELTAEELDAVVGGGFLSNFWEAIKKGCEKVIDLINGPARKIGRAIS